MSLLDKIDSVKKKFLADIEKFPTENDKIIQLRSSYLGRKGEVADLFSQLGSLDSEIRPKVGQTLNKLKKELNSIFDKKLDEVSSIQRNGDNPFVDPGELDKLVIEFRTHPCDYACNHQDRLGSRYADGFGAEIFSNYLMNEESMSWGSILKPSLSLHSLYSLCPPWGFIFLRVTSLQQIWNHGSKDSRNQ